jgi:hypothetical protein
MDILDFVTLLVHLTSFFVAESKLNLCFYLRTPLSIRIALLLIAAGSLLGAGASTGIFDLGGVYGPLCLSTGVAALLLFSRRRVS